MVKENHTTGLEIKPTQVAAGALAAVTAAVLGSNLGVAGTVVGAGIASIVSTVGATLYQHSIDRTREKVKSRVGTRNSATVPGPEDAETVRFTADSVAADTVSPVDDEPTAKRRWPMAVAATVVAFVFGMLVVTGVEWVRGAPLSGGHAGTTAGALFDQPTEKPSHQPTSVTTTSTTPTTTSSPDSTTTAPSSTSATPTTTTTPPATTTTPGSTTTTSPSAPRSSAPAAG